MKAFARFINRLLNERSSRLINLGRRLERREIEQELLQWGFLFKTTVNKRGARSVEIHTPKSLTVTVPFE